MIAEKMKAFVENSSAIRAMFEEGKRQAALYGAENVFDFSLGNPNVPAPEGVKNAILSILDEEDPLRVHGYMSNSGYEDVREAIADSLNQRYSTSYTDQNIVMTVGAAGGMNVVFKTLLNPGDEVIAFAPFFGEYRAYVGNYDGILKVVPPDTETFQPNLSAFEGLITEKTKAVIVNTPNNPTGVVYSEETLKALSEILEQKEKEIGHPIYLISDEPYRELVYGDAKVSWIPSLYPNTIVGYSYSKSLSLPGERIGYLVLPDSLDGSEEIISAANVATRILGYVNAPSLFQRVVARCLDENVDVEYYDRNREALYEVLKKAGLSCIKPEGAFYLFVKSPIEDEKLFCEMAKKHHLLLVAGSSFACPGYVRLAYCVSHEMILRSLPHFEELMKEIAGTADSSER